MSDGSQTTRLLSRARDGDRAALEDLYARIGARLLAIVRLRLDRRLAGIVEPEDVAQEVLLRAFRAIEAFERDGSRSFFAWLAVIATHVINDLRDYHRAGKRDVGRTDPISGDLHRDRHHGALSRLLIDEALARVERALEAMSAEHREVILLRRFEERSFSEIGTVMNRSEDAARMLFARAMAALSEAIR